MVDFIEYGDFKPIGKHKKKTQIILCHTSREVGEYLSSLKFRYNSKYDKIPNYIITREGGIIKLLPDQGYSNFFSDENINMNSVVVSLENLGWLEKKPLTNDYINWNGSIYNKEVFEKKWRDYFFWQPYTINQFDVTLNLCLSLLDELKIKRNFIGHNTKVDGIENFSGVTTRSNYDRTKTDLNPSFDFENFLKKIENGQYTQ
jgi:N-acetyl-anhydromuramyl-L-alanine amidase AmpD